ncbi:DsbA family protein [Pelagibacterium sp. 26DY04]|uniref:DsbA family protein n=1 Tax=Pelagibacterium sp. 26DY04 TaxID=2967130 RepID=UPI0028160D75|nr:DsbA family protein [Pelagibacterium sp. 26DY04]WMT85251.1 DsbA family protein [Pelagibacterium sp. 26DY04]
MQKAINLGLAAAIVLLGAGLAVSLATRPEPGLSSTEVERLIAEALPAQAPANADGAADIDTAALGPIIEDYLMANPRLLERMSVALETEMRAEESERARIALDAMHDDIYNDPANIVLGNPEGDVTLVEMFDYNCGYCRQVVADVMSLVEEDPNLRVILKEFPILSQGSVDAARVGVLVNDADVDYQAFHTALYSSRGAVDGESALSAAEQLGLSRVSLQLDMNTQEVSDALQRTYSIAQALGITGTPTFIIGDEVIPGAVPKEQLVQRIENMRACGATTCSDVAQEG